MQVLDVEVSGFELSVLTPEKKEQIKHGLRKLKYTDKGSQSVVLAEIFGPKNLPLIKQLYDSAGSFAKFFQMESLLSVMRVVTRMERDYWSGDKPLHPQYHQLRKVLVANADKIRKQEEGVRFNLQGEVTIHDDIRNLVKRSKELIIDAEVIERRIKVEPEAGTKQAGEVSKPDEGQSLDELH